MVKHPRHIVGSNLNDDLTSPIEPYSRLLPPLWVIPNLRFLNEYWSRVYGFTSSFIMYNNSQVVQGTDQNMQVSRHLSFELLYSSLKCSTYPSRLERAFSYLLGVDIYIFDFHHFPVANRFVAINRMTPTN